MFLWGICFGAEQPKPNIVFFLVDDLGWNDTSLPMTGEKTKYNNRYQTPNLESLAKQGITFTSAHTQALCVPSRASLLLGQNSINHGVTGDYKPTIDKYRNLEIPPGTVPDIRFALPAILKQVGYKTIHCGKYHLCEYDGQKPTPEDMGFDVNIAGSLIGGPPSYYGQDNYCAKNGKKKVVGLEKYHGSKTHLTEALTSEALIQLEKSVEKEEPFFLYLAHYAVHTPIQAHHPYVDKYELTEDEKVAEAEYASMIEGVDVSLGSVMQKLDELGISDNTILVFYSDNGGRVLWRGAHTLYGAYDFNYPLRSGKASIYEGGLRVPAVVKWPGVSKKGAKSNAPVMIEDWYTTLINAAGAKIPANHNEDGLDLKQVIQGEPVPGEVKNRSMYFYLPYRFEGAVFNGEDFADGGVTPSSAVIKQNWKLIYFHGDERFELYNLAEDIGEKNNLYEIEKKKAKELIKELDAYMRANNAVHPLRLPERIAVKWPLDAFNKMN